MAKRGLDPRFFHQMDETEIRIAALEKVSLTLTPWLAVDVIEDAAATIRAEMLKASGQEREVRAQALQLLTDGQRRYAPPTMGICLKGVR